MRVLYLAFDSTGFSSTCASIHYSQVLESRGGRLGGPKYRRIQLLTIDQLLNGAKVDCPHAVCSPAANPMFKKAPKAKKAPKKSTEKQSRLSEHS